MGCRRLADFHSPPSRHWLRAEQTRERQRETSGSSSADTLPRTAPSNAVLRLEVPGQGLDAPTRAPPVAPDGGSAVSGARFQRCRRIVALGSHVGREDFFWGRGRSGQCEGRDMTCRRSSPELASEGPARASCPPARAPHPPPAHRERVRCRVWAQQRQGLQRSLASGRPGAEHRGQGRVPGLTLGGGGVVLGAGDGLGEERP